MTKKEHWIDCKVCKRKENITYKTAEQKKFLIEYHARKYCLIEVNRKPKR